MLTLDGGDNFASDQPYPIIFAHAMWNCRLIGADRSSGLLVLNHLSTKGQINVKKRTNLTRMDHEGCRGWWVRIQRGDKHVSKLFSDGKYGSNRKAELAAIKFRDEELKKLPKRVFKGSKGPRRTATGYYLRTRVRRGHDERAWVAIWTENGRQMEKSFSVNQHGNAGAKKLAKAYRQEMVKRLLQQDGMMADAAEIKTATEKDSAKKTVVKKGDTGKGDTGKGASKKSSTGKVAGKTASAKKGSTAAKGNAKKGSAKKVAPKKTAKKATKRK